LRPETPEEGVTLAELFAGREVDIPSMLSHLKKAAADCGLPLGTREKTYNTRRAQEVGKWAESRNRGEEYHNAVFKAYFVDGRNIARIPVLVNLAESIGLEGAEEVLARGTFQESVDEDWRYSRECGIAAVPTFMANGRRLVGAQPYEALEKLIRTD